MIKSPAPFPQSSRSWPYWYLVPIYPYGQRQTLLREVVPDTIWVFEQVQGIFYVVVPIRMTVVRLNKGGLLIYSPIAPTEECLALLGELTSKYGPVKYIILPTISGLEHKVNVAPLARHCPKATVYVAPGQWSFPLNLPLSWLGFPVERTKILPADSVETPFAGEFDYAYLGPLDLRLGKFGEVAFFHRASHSLLVTDTLLVLSENPPPVLELDPTPLLFHAKDNARDNVENTLANQAKGWQRICLFALYFQASSLEVSQWRQVWREAQQVQGRRWENYFGLYPFRWQSDWAQTFQTLWGAGKVRVAPILQELILNREPETVEQWVEKITNWPVETLIPCHFSAPVPTNGKQIRQAFSFLQKSSSTEGELLPQQDRQVLQSIDQCLVRWRITPPPSDKRE